MSIEELIASGTTLEGIIVCKECGSSRIESKAWVRTNSKIFTGFCSDREDPNDHYCDKCECNVTVTSYSIFNDR